MRTCAEYVEDICGHAQGIRGIYADVRRVYADMSRVCAEYMRICAGFVQDTRRIYEEYMKNIYGIHDRDRRR